MILFTDQPQSKSHSPSCLWRKSALGRRDRRAETPLAFGYVRHAIDKRSSFILISLVFLFSSKVHGRV
ncbi:hypothetical protein ROHU_007328 [Labeo rohita]|uniref:Uncharacterized protein n=1 Tax=Labeo rohita TaxID=84645 RepID=A0A498MHG6_LABRO|nr:hypothetical protein ROHU_007328 [Labeo rohita]